MIYKTFQQSKFWLSLVLNYVALLLFIELTIFGSVSLYDASYVRNHIIFISILLLLYFALRVFVKDDNEKATKVLPIVDLSSLLIFEALYICLALNASTINISHYQQTIRGLVYFDAGFTSLIYLPLLFKNLKDIQSSRLRKIWSYISLSSLIIPIIVIALGFTFGNLDNIYSKELMSTQALIIPSIILSLYFYSQYRLFENSSNKIETQTLSKHVSRMLLSISILSVLDFILIALGFSYLNDTVIVTSIGAVLYLSLISQVVLYLFSNYLIKKYQLKIRRLLTNFVTTVLILTVLIIQISVYLANFKFGTHHQNTYFLDLIGFTMILGIVFNDYLQNPNISRIDFKVVVFNFLVTLMVPLGIMISTDMYIYFVSFELSFIDIPLMISQVVLYLYLFGFSLYGFSNYLNTSTVILKPSDNEKN